MNISQLRYFTTVAQLENISRAAELLHLSQSSLSKNIAKLEAELGMPLFDRNSRKLSLNAPGVRFQECSGLILRELEAAMEDMRLLATGADFRIKIGMPGACRRLVDCAAAFDREHPGTEFDFNCSIESEEHPDINAFDVLVYPDEVRYEKFRGYPFGREKCFLAVPAGMAGDFRGAVTARSLNGLNLVFLRSDREHMEHAHRICSALAVRFGSQCFADSRSLHIQMIASGMAAGFVPEGESAAYQENRSIRLLPILDERFSRNLMICFRRDKHLSALARSFRDFAVDYFDLKT
ncbi:MAG: LysR family transcriptional regulator [Oscillospiraceae bacterium]